MREIDNKAFFADFFVRKTFNIILAQLDLLPVYPIVEVGWPLDLKEDLLLKEAHKFLASSKKVYSTPIIE